MPLPAGQETEEIAAREARVRKFGKKTETGPDYLKIAAEQRDNGGGGVDKKHPLDFTYEVPVERLRTLGHLRHLQQRQSGIEDFGTPQAVAFMTLYSDQLRERLDQTLRDFVKGKLSK
jgi:hypothetical protein